MTSDVRGLSRGDEAAGRDERLEISVSRERDSEAAGLSPCSWSVRELASVLARRRDSTDRRFYIALER